MSAPTYFKFQEEISVNSKKKTLIIFGTLVFLIAFTAMIKVVIDYWGKEEEIIHDVGVTLPETWYYDRTMMDMPVCQEDSTVRYRKYGIVPTVKDKVLVGYVDHDCRDVQSCVEIVRDIADQANFFIASGRVFEGNGWKCNYTEMLTVKFIGDVDWSEILLFHVLMKEGIVNHEMRPKTTVLIDKTSCNKEECSLLTTLGDIPK